MNDFLSENDKNTNVASIIGFSILDFINEKMRERERKKNIKISFLYESPSKIEYVEINVEFKQVCFCRFALRFPMFLVLDNKLLLLFIYLF